MRQHHARRMSQQNWQGFRLLYFSQVNDHFHSKLVTFGETFAMRQWKEKGRERFKKLANQMSNARYATARPDTLHGMSEPRLVHLNIKIKD